MECKGIVEIVGKSVDEINQQGFHNKQQQIESKINDFFEFEFEFSTLLSIRDLMIKECDVKKYSEPVIYECVCELKVELKGELKVEFIICFTMNFTQ